MSSTATWLTDITKTAAGFTFNAEENSGTDTREGIVFVIMGGRYFKVTVTQGTTKGATSARAREIAGNAAYIRTVTSDSYTRIDEHVGMLQMQFTGQYAGTSHPMAMYMYEVDLSGDVTLAVSCADDDDSSIKPTSASTTVLQTVRKQLSAMQKNNSSWTVLGGVNGDFFRSVDRNLIQGVCHRNGVCLKDSFYDGTCAVLAIRKDGTAMIMDQGQYDGLKSQIQEAVGGRQRLVAYGKVHGNNNAVYEPRTAVGVSEDGKTVYLLVIDGRRESWSYGAQFYDLAEILIAAGAYNAINLDGGGSSIFVQRMSEDGTADTDYDILNEPRDDDGNLTERAIANGLAIVKR